jgi:hypothetical protein
LYRFPARTPRTCKEATVFHVLGLPASRPTNMITGGRPIAELA